MSTTDAARAAMQESALSDKSSAYYKGMVNMLRAAEAAERRARMASKHVTVPFHIDEEAVSALEEQFSVAIRVKGTVNRMRATPRVAAMSCLVEAALSEYAGGAGRSVLSIDGDAVTMAVTGLNAKVLERSSGSARLAYGYFMEDDALKKLSFAKGFALSPAADLLLQEMTAGGGDHYFPAVRESGPLVNSITVNHLKTNVGPRQLAYLALRRGATVYGAIPFQPGMLLEDEGSLDCFPGRYYVDRKADVITFVPKTDATMSISHSYSSLMEFVENNTVGVAGREFLCEKFNSVRGVLYYTLKLVGEDFEAPEVLMTSLFDTKKVGVTEISYPKVRFSAEGVPVGWERGAVRALTSRVEMVMARAAVNEKEVVLPSDVFGAIMDYNNDVVQSLDAVVVASRMSNEAEEELALAIALHVNIMRHMAKKTFSTLLNAIKLRYAVKDTSLIGLALVAMSAWWSRPGVSSDVRDSVPVPDVLDWCGNDFSVVMDEVDPWIEIRQVSGVGGFAEGRTFPWFPVPESEGGASWIDRLCDKARAAVGNVAVKVGRVASSAPTKLQSACAGYSSLSLPALVDETCCAIAPKFHDLTPAKAMLKGKLKREQFAVKESVPLRFMRGYSAVRTEDLPNVPVVDVDPVSAISDDILMVNKGAFERSAVATGYRIAELEISKVTEGSYSFNDAKRNIPRAKWVRLPKVDAGVEGNRPASAQSLLGAMYKRNVGVPANRGMVNLDKIPAHAVERVIAACYREDWKDTVEKHLNTGMWQPNDEDLVEFLMNLDEFKVKKMLNEFFVEGHVDLTRWLLMAKGKIKSSRVIGKNGKVDHSQTIMYQENSSVNAIYSSMVKRFKTCVDECLRPEVKLNAQESDEEHERWYNSLEAVRKSYVRTYSYAADISTYDRSQEHVGLRICLEFYRRHGLDRRRLEIWEKMFGVKKAAAMMFGIVLAMVLGGVSGVFDTLLRNGLINLAALVVSGDIKHGDIVMVDVKGDDLDAEFSRLVAVETAVERLSLTFNLSAKFFTNDVRYMCKQFRLKLNGVWYFVADPWARVQSLCTPLWLGSHDVDMDERWVSVCADLRHYDNGLLVDMAAEAAKVLYGSARPLYGMARGLSAIRSDKNAFLSFFGAPIRVD